MILFGIFYLFSQGGRIKTNIETIEHAPFTIKRKNTYSSRYDINTARRVNNSRSYYSIYHQGQLISFPDALDANTGVAGLWKVLTLKDAPQPTLIAASKSAYLITEENNKVKITPLIEQNSGFVSLEWLDSMDGQLDSEIELYSSDDTKKDCQIVGGQFLLVNKKTVLDISDLSVYSFQTSSDLTHDYSANNAIGFSPGKESIVYMGSKYDGEYHYALLIYNFKTNQAYTIPFDRTDTRLHEPHDLHSDWLSTYFVWEQKEKEDFILERRKLDSFPNWEGHFTKEQSFAVSPVRKEMLEVVAKFTKNYLQLSDVDVQLEPHGAYMINAGQSKLRISYLDKLGSVFFSDHILDENEEECKKVIKKIGSAFNAELRKGAHQSLFSSY